MPGKGKQEYAEILTPSGVRLVIPRGDLSDEDWEAVLAEQPTSLPIPQGQKMSQLEETGDEPVESLRLEIGEPEIKKRVEGPAVDVEIGEPRLIRREGKDGFVEKWARQTEAKDSKAPGEAKGKGGFAGPLGGIVGSVLSAATKTATPNSNSQMAEALATLPPGATPQQRASALGQAAAQADPNRPFTVDEMRAMLAEGTQQPPQALPPQLPKPDMGQFMARSAPQLVPPAPAAPASQSASMSMSRSGPTTPIPGSSVGPVEKKIEDAFKRRADAEVELADIEMKKQQRISERQEMMARQMEMSQAVSQDIAVRRRLEQEEAQKAYESTIKQLNDPAMTVDKDRLWNSRSTGQKVLAGISILLGGMGQGTFAAMGVHKSNDALKIIQGAIKEDIDVQKTNIDNKRQGLKDEAEGQRTIYNMLRQQGMDELEAYRAEEAAKIDMVQKEIEAIASQMTGEGAKAQAQAAIAKLEQDKNKLLFDVAQHRDSMAMKRAQLGMQREALSMKASQGQGAGRPLPASSADRLGEMMDALQRAKGYSAEFKQKASSFFDKALKYVPRTDAANFMAKREAMIQLIGKALEEGVLREGDVDRYRLMLPEAGDLHGGVKMDTIVNELEKKFKTRTSAFGAAGYNVGGFEGLQSTPRISREQLDALGIEFED
jgi:hypothetical protein